jgi:hypothetical protein
VQEGVVGTALTLHAMAGSGGRGWVTARWCLPEVSFAGDTFIVQPGAGAER